MLKTRQDTQLPSDFETTVENLEKEYYLKPKFYSALEDEVKSKIAEFSNWFNGTARLHLLKCDPIEREVYVYMLLNLKKKLKLAISEINKSVSNRHQSYICNVCNEKIEVQPWQNVWDKIQDHPHFEECYSKTIDETPSIVTEPPEDDKLSTNDSLEDLSGKSVPEDSENSIPEDTENSILEDSENLVPEDSENSVLEDSENSVPEDSENSVPEDRENSIPEDSEKSQDFKFNFQASNNEIVEKTALEDDAECQVSVNDLKFNFEVPYDERIEKTLYPEALVRAAHKVDHLPDYTIQRHSTDQGVCLLCPCSIISKGKISKMTPFVVKSHAYGRKHKRNALITNNTSALLNYHEFWRRQVAIYQAHQLYFVPEISVLDRCKCQLCQQPVPYDDVINHIQTNKLHKTRVFKILKSPKDKLNEFALFDMQVEMYEDIKEEKKQKNPKRGAHGKCVFVKLVIKPNQVNLQPRYKAHLKLFTKNADFVSCRVCKMSFCNSCTVIRKHILSTKHIQLSGIPLQEYIFCCGICKRYLKDEEAWDEHFTKGPNNHHNISQKRRLKVAEYDCSTCNCVIYGDQSSLNAHISSRQPKRDRTKEMKSQDKDLKQTKIDVKELLKQLEETSGMFLRSIAYVPPKKKKTSLQNKPKQDENLKQETDIELAQFSSGPSMMEETISLDEAMGILDPFDLYDLKLEDDSFSDSFNAPFDDYYFG